MFPALSPNRRTRDRLRRAAALTLFALQGAMALSPIAEPRHSGPVRTHIEERGRIHVYAHDESTCALCSVRSMHAAVPARQCRIASAPGQHCVVAPVSRAVPAPDDGPTNLSRAPPLAV